MIDGTQNATTPTNVLFVETNDNYAMCVDKNGIAYGQSYTNPGWSPAPLPSLITSLSFGDTRAAWFISGSAAGDNPVQYVAYIGAPQTVTNVSGVQVSVGTDGEAWVLQSDGSLWRWNTFAAVFEKQASSLTVTRLAVADQNLQWGLDASDNVVQRSLETQTWAVVAPGPGTSKIVDLSAADDGSLYVVTADGSAYLYVGGDQTWMPFGGSDVPLRSLSVCDTAHAWGVAQDGTLIEIGTGSTQAEGSQLAPGTLGWDTQSVFDETKSTHLYLVNRAAQLASTAQSPAGPFVAANLQPMQSPPQAGTFRQALCQGLRDADFLAPYNDPNRLGVATYASHFYDDTTGLNYEGEPEPTALTNGVKFFNLSVAAMRQAQPDPQAGGYNLGLALHYFTDLTQPMHSGNYTYLSSIPLGYHTQFEEYAMGVQATLVPQPTVVGFVPGGVNDPGQLYRAASQHFKATYLDQVIAAHKYFSWYWSPAQWQAAVLQLLPAIFNDSVQNTSQLVYLWATLVQAPHEDFAPEAAGVG